MARCQFFGSVQTAAMELGALHPLLVLAIFGCWDNNEVRMKLWSSLVSQIFFDSPKPGAANQSFETLRSSEPKP